MKLHGGEAHGTFAIPEWFWDVALAGGLAVASAVYATGVARMWRSAGVGHGIRRWQVACYAAGMLSIVFAVLSPFDGLADVFFAAHMSQHEVLMLISAPLIVLGQPSIPAAWATSLARRPGVAASWRAITNPLVVLALHAAVLWIWHIPRLFEAALHSESVHAGQHVLFFATAALFWWAIIHGRYGRVGYGVSVVYVFVTALHSSILGALATIAPSAWYPTHAERALARGVDPMADQQLAGLIMWIPTGVIFVAVALALLAAWIGESERRALRREKVRGLRDA